MRYQCRSNQTTERLRAAAAAVALSLACISPALAADMPEPELRRRQFGLTRVWQSLVRLPFVVARFLLDLLPVLAFLAVGTALPGTEIGDLPTPRFVILAKDPDDAEPGNGAVMTTFLFRVRNVPAALYKALGGFATNGVNMTKLESYQEEGTFNATMFFADIEGHPVDRPVQLALEELSFFSTQITIFGTYPASPFRKEAAELAASGQVPLKRSS